MAAAEFEEDIKLSCEKSPSLVPVGLATRVSMSHPAESVSTSHRVSLYEPSSDCCIPSTIQNPHLHFNLSGQQPFQPAGAARRRRRHQHGHKRLVGATRGGRAVLEKATADAERRPPQETPQPCAGTAAALGASHCGDGSPVERQPPGPAA